MSVMDGFGVIGIFINSLADIGLDHVVKHLKHISNHGAGAIDEFFQKLVEGNRGTLFLLPHGRVQFMQRGVNGIFWNRLLLSRNILRPRQ